MNKCLTEYEKFKIIRPIVGGCEYDTYKRPIIRKTDIADIDWNSIKVTNLKNASVYANNTNSLLLMFNYDKELMRLWNDPLRKVCLWQSFAAVCSPDFSVYPSMNINDISHNIYMSRWLGRTWQNYGCKVIPTVAWSLPDTYDLCFEGIEYGSVVAISTLGCHSNIEDFLMGFKQMMARINPSLVIVYGDMIEGMFGTFINFRYVDGFNRKYEQLSLFNEKVFTIMGGK
ncbi:DUF4417 domain-containing protein [uncultured Ruminobacter sp.]|uniref:DUF4417 domain-containing protein n=2 Tax=Ruminobacter sp. TaxID=2774296 RepID=UPI00262F8051|nr:DUF4417 domain-containing protein [uncultured Ruminobacter sp.]